MSEEILKKLGVKIGHYTDEVNLKGTTVFVAEEGAQIGIDVRGSNTGTFNTPMYGAKGTAEIMNAVVLTGGSTFGLESVMGAMQYLEEHGIGYKTRAALIPGMVGAVIYDLAVGNGRVRPGKKEGYKAASNASYRNLQQGNVGVGTGATVGKWFKGKNMKGGFGIAFSELPEDIVVVAFVVTNSLGDIVNPNTGKFYMDEGGYDLNDKKIKDKVTKLSGLIDLSPKNTTLSVIATNVAMDRRQLMKVAELAHDGMARAIFPVHTMMDGDVVFALSSLSGEHKSVPGTLGETLIDLVGIAAQDALMKAIKNSILHAKDIDNFPSYKTIQNPPNR
jgi:L-aminopeptidase/D-esterase-like protein